MNVELRDGQSPENAPSKPTPLGEKSARVPGYSSTFVGTSPAMVQAFQAAKRFAGIDASVLICGEPGTGKRRLARFIHEQSQRSGGPFVVVSLASIPADRVETELLGSEPTRGIGTAGAGGGRFELASGGTIYIDEVDNLGLQMQSQVLRAVETGTIGRLGEVRAIPVDVRLIASTKGDLKSAAEEGHFRRDLYGLLAANVIELPPLRKRGDDVKLLAEHYAAYYAREYQRPIRGLATETLALLYGYRWPGNIRQLRHAMERAVLLARGEAIRPADVLPELFEVPPQ